MQLDRPGGFFSGMFAFPSLDVGADVHTKVFTDLIQSAILNQPPNTPLPATPLSQ